MSGAPRVRSMNMADSETRPILGPNGNNKAGGVGLSLSGRKPSSKPLAMSKVDRSPEEKKKQTISTSTMYNSSSHHSPKPHTLSASSVLRRHEQLLHSNLSMNASCSSDASTDSFHSRASTGRLVRSYSAGSRRKAVSRTRSVASDSGLGSPTSPGGSPFKKTCAWVTPNTDPGYAAFHDEEWGVPVHDDKKLFELLVLSGALAELTWPAILSKRHIFRFSEVFADFDPIAVSKLNEKKLLATGSKVIDEFGSFDKYMWSFVNNKPISVCPTVVYSFLQAAGITNDHLVSCFRFQDCIDMAEGKEVNGTTSVKAATEGVEQQQQQQDSLKLDESEISMAIDDLNLSSE
ncbi:Probable GMP synthase [glutamine-hydrolyzing] [Linum perenne]